ncbi:MAG: UbiD family decarboxylase [Deltaproteobacteria bacterium]|nr:UbiD family decarboxylase [Deltaproteobacteria bacterium]
MKFHEEPSPNYRDLRGWLERVERSGELKIVRGTDWDLEMAGLAEIVSREAKGTAPALLFDQIKGVPEGYRALFLQLDSVGRLALTLGLNLDRPDKTSCVKACRDRLAALELQSPRFVERGAVQENFARGDEIDLFRFPLPKHHELDGGRYFGTAHCVITQDPDTGWVNLGTYRCMVFDKKSVGLHMSPGRHGRTMRDKCFERSQPFKVAVAVGVDPALFLSSTMAVPAGVSEYAFAGGLKGSPIEVLEGPYTKLPIPAHAEIVIEGECVPGETREEGPFGEWAGYYANCGLTPVPEPVINVKNLLYRNNPILTCAQPARPPGYNFAFCVFRSAMIWDEIEKAGVPDVRGVWCHEAGGSRLFNVVSIKQRYPGHSRQAGMIASQCASGVYIGRYTVVVDDDIEPTNLADVVWAIATRADPESAIEIVRRCRSSSADPAISPDLKGTSANPAAVFTSKAVIDACRPYEWKDRAYPVVEVSPELRKQLLAKWGDEFKGVL